MTMREKIARAVCDRLTGSPCHVRSDDLSNVTLDGQFDMLDAMDAALEALMNPTEEMCVAGYDNAEHSIESVGSLAPEPEEQPRLIFQEMIRAAREGK